MCRGAVVKGRGGTPPGVWPYNKGAWARVPSVVSAGAVAQVNGAYGNRRGTVVNRTPTAMATGRASYVISSRIENGQKAYSHPEYVETAIHKKLEEQGSNKVTCGKGRLTAGVQTQMDNIRSAVR